jgi:hypothetical protein
MANRLMDQHPKKGDTIMKTMHIGSVLVMFAAVGCSSPGVSVPTSMRVGALQVAGAQQNVPQKDAPAANAFTSLKALASQNALASVSLGVYSLTSATQVSDRVGARATVLGLPAKPSIVHDDLMHLSTVKNGNWALTLNDLSEGEEYVDTSRNHLGNPVLEASLSSDDQYVGIARDYATRTFAAAFTALSPYTYRVRKYFDAHSSGKGTQVDGVYQLAVAFNSTIDGLPIIGPGGKVAVDMTTDGTVVRHESLLRHPGPLVHVISGAGDLVTPQAAEAAVEARLDARGIDRTKFQISRREFGYFMYGRKSIQTVLVPYYGFFFEPVPGTSSKILVEVEPATNEPQVLATIASDAQAEVARKAPLMAKADTRPRQ